MSLKNKTHGFKVPKDYFDDHQKLQKGLTTLAKANFAYKVPPAYFEKSEKELLELIPQPKKRVIQLIPYASSIAACLVLAFSLKNSSGELEDSVAIEHYFEEQESPLTTAELFEFTPLDAFDTNSIAFENLAQETVFELQQAYDPDFNLIYEDYED